MKFGIRLRFALWLVAALLPVGLSATYVVGRIETELAARVATDLEGLGRLEAARIESSLDLYREHGQNLASGPHVREFTSEVVRSIEAGQQQGDIGGYDGFTEIDAFASKPLQELADALQRKTDSTTAEVASLRIQGRDGTLLGESPGFDWKPVDPSLLEQAMSSRATIIGNAYRDSSGSDRVGVVVPIVGDDGNVVGVLMLENQLGPIVDLVSSHEGFGETSEAHIAQATADGDAEFITLLRFERDAAFTKIVPTEKNLPINQSLDAPDGLLVFSPDYRGEESILALQTIEETGWGLVVKIDRAEALEPVLSHTSALKGIAALGALGVLVGWAVLLDPIARRLRSMADGAERVASGDLGTPLDDRRSDEIGSVATNIDRLATDLAADIAVRTDIEERLRYQATHDATTGLYNRPFATSLMGELDEAAEQGGAAYSLLFLDLDNFKTINDVYGHATGDAVLAEVAARLEVAAGEGGNAARWGGDEFVVVLPATDNAGAEHVVAQVEAAMQTPIQTDAGVHHVRTSIGASTRLSGESVEQLLHRADELMFAQKQGRNGRRSVSPESVRIVERALENDTVDVWFQPVVEDDGTKVSVQGAEALVRLHNSSGEPIAPGTFLRDVQRSPVGRNLDRRVLAIALGKVAEWIQAGRLRSDFRLGVNCCEALLSDASTVAFLAGLLDELGLEPHNLMLEISQASTAVPLATVQALDEIGIQIAVDDLGLNHSNVDRLIDSCVSVAKIDHRWLHRNEDHNTDNATVLHHLVSLCDSLGFEVIAEGVETADQLAELRAVGVSTYQGFLFAGPLSAQDFASRFFG